MKGTWRTYRSWSSSADAQGAGTVRCVPADRALVVDSLPPTLQLLFAVFALRELATAVEQRRRQRLRCEAILRDAMQYRSWPEEEMDSRLDATRLLLLTQGFTPRGLRGPLAAEQATCADEPKGPPKDAQRARIATFMARAVKRTLHPDVTGSSHVLGEDEVAQAIARANDADRRGDLNLAYEVLLETLPKYYARKVCQALTGGPGLDAVVSEHPDAATHLRWVLWLSTQPGWRLGDLPYPRLAAAQAEAVRMRKEAAQLTLAHAYALAYTTAEDILNYRRTKPTDAAGMATLTEVLADMAMVGRELWDTEAALTDFGPTSVLVSRLHAGVGREVRAVGNAVHHVGKVLAPDRVYPVALASAASTLRQGVTWVANALAQFQMELRVARRREAPARPMEVSLSSISGLPTRIN